MVEILITILLFAIVLTVIGLVLYWISKWSLSTCIKVDIFIGVILLIFQLLSYVTESPSFAFQTCSAWAFFNSLMSFLGYNLIGIVGAFFLIVGIVTHRKKRKQQR